MTDEYRQKAVEMVRRYFEESTFEMTGDFLTTRWKHPQSWMNDLAAYIRDAERYRAMQCSAQYLEAEEECPR